MSQNGFVTAFVGALLGLIPTITSALIEWMEKRSRANQREQAIEFAQNQVTFLSSWLGARQQSESGELDKIKQMIASELDEIKAHVDSVLEIQVEAPVKSIKERDFIQREFLLYTPRSTSGRIYRALFFVFVGMTVLLGVFFVSTSGPSYFGDPASLVFGIIFLLLPTLLPAILFNRLAIHSDRKEEEKLAPAKQ